MSEASTASFEVAFLVNGGAVSDEIAPRTTLVDYLRQRLGLTGTHVGCEHGVCGACHVRVDGQVLRGCLLFAVQVDGADVQTIEGLSSSGEIADLQEAFVRRNAMQCGFCTPGMLMIAAELLARREVLSREAIRDALSGNYCRCTGYQSIVDAIEEVARARYGIAA
jgi:carbon-monoxide dehydrogenase small subunit